MGENKAKLKINGKTFLERLAGELRGFDELIVSVDDIGKHPDIKYPMVGDLYPGCGPMAGLHAALSVCRSDALLAVSCDIPFFDRKLGAKLCALMTESADAVVPTSPEGRMHPLCAVYKKNCALVFKEYLDSGNYRLRDALDGMRIITVPSDSFSQALININTREDYEKLCLKEG